MSRNLAYLVSDATTPEGLSVLLGHIAALKKHGHRIIVYYVRADDRTHGPLDLPVFEFNYADYGNLVRMAQSDSSIKVATDWRTAHMVADICPEQCLYLLLEDEFRRAPNLYEARATRNSYRLGLPMVSVSAWLAAEVETIGGVRPRVVRPGVDHGTFAPDSTVRDPNRLLCLRRDGADKSLTEAIALAAISVPELSVRSMGIPLGVIEGVPVHGLENRDPNAMAAEFLSAGCFVYDGGSTVYVTEILEAMACGCPVVCAQAPAVADYCEDGHDAVIVAKSDSGALSSAIVRVLRDPDLSDRLGKNGIEKAARYSWDAHVSRFSEILHEASGEDIADGVGVPSVSIVIPTKNGGTDFFFLMRKIKQVADDFDVEVVVVDSGSTDSTVETAREHGATIIEIPPDDFNHGTTRNVGADAATGEYILFFTQDAIPMGRDWLSRMIQPMIDDPKLAAVRGREIPRSDADLFCGWMDSNYHGDYTWKADQLIDLKGMNVHDLEPAQKRYVAQLADTVTCVRADVFRRFRFHDVNFAEDLDLGIRLLEHGYRLLFLFHGGVVHSHNREAVYIMKRFYVDSKLTPGVLGHRPAPAHFDGAAALASARELYASVKRAAGRVASEPADLALIHSAARMESLTEDKARGDATLEALFADLPQTSLTTQTGRQNLLRESFSALLSSFAGYFERVYGSYETLEPEMADCLYKLFAASVGMQLGSLAAASQVSADEITRHLDATLSAGV